jgi:hypothetical protein
MSRARISLLALFALWSVLLFGSSGLIEWIGNGLVQLLAHIHLGWLGTILTGLGKALIFIVWLASAILFTFGFTVAGRLSKAASAAANHGSPQNATTTTVTLERDTDGSYR